MPQLSPEAVEALLKRERKALVGRLLRGLVHNLSGAVQMVRLPLDLLEMKLTQGLEADVAGKLGSAQEGLKRLGDELAVLSDYSASIQSEEPTDVDLARMASDQLAFWHAHPYFKHEVELATELNQGAAKARAAYVDLALAFNALVANAVESLQESGRRGLKVRLVRRQGQVGLEVADEGPGVPDGLGGGPMAAFSTAKNGEHDGLGLFLASRALAPHGGALDHSAGPPCAFSMWLPEQ